MKPLWSGAFAAMVAFAGLSAPASHAELAPATAGYSYRAVAPMVARDGPSTYGEHLPKSSWGGDQIHLEVTGTGATIEFSCAHASIDGPIVLDGLGHFDVRGTFVREHGGPIREDEPPDAHPARFSGTVDGDAMTLSITLTDDGSTMGPFALTKGVPGRVVKCL